MRRVILALLMAAAVGISSQSIGFAANPHNGTTGQPSQSCGSSTAPNTPGNASSASGSAFNPNGNAGTHYAGQQPQNSNNPKSVSQYDVACFQVSQPH
jgi:hypothetical protein